MPEVISASERALAYQEQITGLPPPLAVKLNGVWFDGCDENTGTMLEAKGEGYQWALKGPNTWIDNYKGLAQIMKSNRSTG